MVDYDPYIGSPAINKALLLASLADDLPAAYGSIIVSSGTTSYTPASGTVDAYSNISGIDLVIDVESDEVILVTSTVGVSSNDADVAWGFGHTYTGGGGGGSAKGVESLYQAHAVATNGQRDSKTIVSLMYGLTGSLTIHTYWWATASGDALCDGSSTIYSGNRACTAIKWKKRS